MKDNLPEEENEEVSDEVNHDQIKFRDFLWEREYKVRSFYTQLGLGLIALNWAIINSAFFSPSRFFLISASLGLVSIFLSYLATKWDAEHIRYALMSVCDKNEYVNINIESKASKKIELVNKHESKIFYFAIMLLIFGCITSYNDYSVTTITGPNTIESMEVELEVENMELEVDKKVLKNNGN
jgi:hypothetical protein